MSHPVLFFSGKGHHLTGIPYHTSPSATTNTTTTTTPKPPHTARLHPLTRSPVWGGSLWRKVLRALDGRTDSLARTHTTAPTTRGTLRLLSSRNFACAPLSTISQIADSASESPSCCPFGSHDVELASQEFQIHRRDTNWGRGGRQSAPGHGPHQRLLLNPPGAVDSDCSRALLPSLP